jgi:hypothetical protein
MAISAPRLSHRQQQVGIHTRFAYIAAWKIKMGTWLLISSGLSIEIG